ncbi:MAG: hypothetical protein ACOCZQ_00075 [Nanoarchaeota archaeon]
MDAFERAVNYYKEEIGNVKGKTFFVVIPLQNNGAFFSIAPLSKAIHENGGDIHISAFDGHSPVVESMLKTWKIHKGFLEDKKTKDVLAFKNFVKAIERKTKSNNFIKLFKAPDYILRGGHNGFMGSLGLAYKDKWVKKRRWKTLLKTCSVILDQVYNLKPKDRLGIGFETIPSKENLDKPLQDYLDSYLITKAMLESALEITGNVTMNTSSPRYSMLKDMERVGNLKATLLGCELCKESKEAVFKRFRDLSRFIGTGKIKHNTATFFIAGKGTPGKHFFGQEIGYPTKNGKSRWQSPAGIIYQPPHAPQTKHDERAPKARVAFTETLPVEVFIKTCNVDWFEIKRKNDALADVAKKSVKFVVKSNTKGKYKTEFEIGLRKKNKEARIPQTSDVDTRNIIDKEFYKRTGIKAGNMGNLPGGEMFVTPEYMEGTAVGDVVINIDQSYSLSKQNPFVIQAAKKGYKVVKGPKKVIDAFTKKKGEAWGLLKKQEKVMPKELIDVRKKNFNSIGEFAINTNPKAEVCDYLIVNEKVADMIHVAMGSGFEDDKATDYHSDLVIDAKRQRLDIYGVDEAGNKYPLMEKGNKLV